MSIYMLALHIYVCCHWLYRQDRGHPHSTPFPTILTHYCPSINTLKVVFITCTLTQLSTGPP